LLVGAGRGVRPELFLACAQVVLVLQVFQLRRQYPAQQTHKTAKPQQHPPSPAQEPQPQQQQASMINPQPTLTLAQITKGFMQELEEARAGAMNMKGSNTGHPSEEQLRVGRYAQRVLECLVGSYHRNRHRAPLTTQQARIIVFVTIDRDGRLASFKVAQSSGSASVDNFIETIFRDASSAFPPMPKAFTKPSFPVRFNIPDIHSLSSSANWSYG